MCCFGPSMGNTSVGRELDWKARNLGSKVDFDTNLQPQFFKGHLKSKYMKYCF